MKFHYSHGGVAHIVAAVAVQILPSISGLWLSGEVKQTKEETREDFDHLRLSVLRVQAFSSTFDWLHPFETGDEGGGVGSAFVVQVDPYPLFVTNAHVINDARSVTLQLLLYGEHEWDAEVVAVSSKFDLALMVLKDPVTFTSKMASRNITLQALKLAMGVPAMGADVVALGFPLGQNKLKISKGNVAGNEYVDGNICIQSTAPISPGSSGGPLLDLRGQAVVGVNFAQALDGENVNYVIPAWRVAQIVLRHLKEQPETSPDTKWKRLQFRVPQPELTTVVANEPLYALSGGCKRGVYIAKVGKRSFLRNAQPSVVDGAFLVSVNGKELDSFGMGLNEEYAADRVDFADLFHMVPDLSGSAEMQTCSKGVTTTHSLSMAWAPEYELGVHWIDEPRQDGRAGAYELFADMSIMELTINHIDEVLKKYEDPGPTRWLHPDLITEPRLIVNYVKPGSYASSVVGVGSAVEKINGKVIRTLQEFRQNFAPAEALDVWTLETDRSKIVAVMFNQSVAEQLTAANAPDAHYLRTDTVVRAAAVLGLSGYASRLGGPDTEAQVDIEQGPSRTTPLAAHHEASPSVAMAMRNTEEVESSRTVKVMRHRLVASGPLIAHHAAVGRGVATIHNHLPRV